MIYPVRNPVTGEVVRNPKRSRAGIVHRQWRDQWVSLAGFLSTFGFPDRITFEVLTEILPLYNTDYTRRVSAVFSFNRDVMRYENWSDFSVEEIVSRIRLLIHRGFVMTNRKELDPNLKGLCIRFPSSIPFEYDMDRNRIPTPYWYYHRSSGWVSIAPMLYPSDQRDAAEEDLKQLLDQGIWSEAEIVDYEGPAIVRMG